VSQPPFFLGYYLDFFQLGLATLVCTTVQVLFPEMDKDRNGETYNFLNFKIKQEKFKSLNFQLKESFQAMQ
jgi:hypothetical protein